ncbi:monocarboxylate transporter 12-like [Diadema setosum]|uniref:monocarboxylate transporter 12-like n=1 Tax=Diadema setosum TaxID=31175 RepID=UPI003B3B6450
MACGGARRWLVVAGAMFVLFLEAGTAKSFGVLLVDVTRNLKVSTGFAGLVFGSSQGLVYLLSLFSTPLLKRFSMRQLAMAGGLIGSVGLMLSSLAENGSQFAAAILIYGVGYSALVILANACPADYFPDSFQVASSVLIAGGGIGNMILPVVTQLITDAYGWKSALLMLGALNLHSVVYGALIKPSKPQGRVAGSNPDHAYRPVFLEEAKWNESSFVSANITYSSTIATSLEVEDCLCDEDKEQTPSMEANVSASSLESSVNDADCTCSSNSKGDRVNFTIAPASPRDDESEESCASESQSSPKREDMASRILFLAMDSSERGRPIMSKSSLVELSAQNSTGHSPRTRTVILQYEGQCKQQSQTCCSPVARRGFTTFLKAFDFYLYRDFPLVFTVLSINVVLYAVTYIAWVVFLIPNAEAKGIPSDEAVFLATIGGVADIAGRFVAGFIAEKVWMDNDAFYVVMSVVAGGAFLINYLASSFWFLGILAALNGFTLGVKTTLINILVKIKIPDDRFKAALSIIFFVSGVGAPVSGIVMGAIFDVTGSYNISFCIAGVVDFAAAAVILLPHVRCGRREAFGHRTLPD